MNKALSIMIRSLLILSFSATSLIAMIELQATITGVPFRSILMTNRLANYDYNDDGVPDMCFIPSDFPVLIIQDGINHTHEWVTPLPPYGPDGGGWPTVIGYFELDNSNDTKEIVLAAKQERRFIDPIVIDSDGTILWNGAGKVLLTVSNMEADVPVEEEEDIEIVVYDSTLSVVEIWGTPK